MSVMMMGLHYNKNSSLKSMYVAAAITMMLIMMVMTTMIVGGGGPKSQPYSQFSSKNRL